MLSEYWGYLYLLTSYVPSESRGNALAVAVVF